MAGRVQKDRLISAGPIRSVLSLASPVAGFLSLLQGSAVGRGATTGGANHKPFLAAMLKRLHGRIPELPYQDLRRPLAELRWIDSHGRERRISVTRLLHVVEANHCEILAGPEPLQHEPVQHAEGDYIVEAERRRWRVPECQHL